jgi:hypothetical protein
MKLKLTTQLWSNDNSKNVPNGSGQTEFNLTTQSRYNRGWKIRSDAKFSRIAAAN